MGDLLVATKIDIVRRVLFLAIAHSDRQSCQKTASSALTTSRFARKRNKMGGPPVQMSIYSSCWAKRLVQVGSMALHIQLEAGWAAA